METVTYPLSYAQQRLWLLDQLEPGNAAHNMRGAYRLHGPLQVDILDDCLADVVRRHGSLRTTFSMSGGQAIQIVRPDLQIRLARVALPTEDALQLLMIEDSRRTFDLTTGPLLRVTLYSWNREQHAILFVMHHIISDGWSMGVFIRELLELYDAKTSNRPARLHSNPASYVEYVRWQRQSLTPEFLDREIAHWKAKLRGAPAALDLPTDRPRPTEQTFNGQVRSLQISRQRSQQLDELCSRCGVTLFMVLLAIYAIWLRRITGQEDLVVGTYVANRGHPEFEETIGFFVNTLALRLDLGGEPTFEAALQRVRHGVLDGLDHAQLPFEMVVDACATARDMGRTPLVQVVLLLQNTPSPELTCRDVTLEHLDVNVGMARFDLTLIVWRNPDGLTLKADYNGDLFDAATVDNMLRQIQTLAGSAVDHPDRKISQLPMLSPEEEHRLLVEWNRTAADYPADVCLHQLFEAQVQRTPTALALVEGHRRVTYAELNEKANRFAHFLRSRGIGRNTVVGVYLSRSVEAAIAILAVLKANGTYLPLDPDYPDDRIQFMLNDARPPVVFTVKQFASRIRGGSAMVQCLDSADMNLTSQPVTDPGNTAFPDDAAYLIYTSGSTGQPKGVLGRHRGAVNRFCWMWKAYPFQDGEMCCQKTSLGFVDSVWEQLGPLLQGVPSVVVADEDVKDPRRLLAVLSAHGVSRIVLVPSLLRVLLDGEEKLAERVPKLKFWVCSGEALSKEICRRFQKQVPEATLLNLYGSSEVSADVTFFDTRGLSETDHTVPIGRPIDNTQIYVLDSALQPAPVGVAGEIHVGGDGLAAGYLGQSELTHKKFIPHPFLSDPKARLYKTGDVGRYRRDGQIEFLGRVDRQVKLRGYRVELGDVESALLRLPEVRDVVVAATETGPNDKQLFAYVVARDAESIRPDTLRQSAAKLLPGYMVPARFIQIDAVPLSPNGKVDWDALALMESVSRESEGERRNPSVAPQTPVELAIAEVWRKALSVDGISVHDTFYDLGGHSLLSITVTKSLQEKLAIALAPRELLFQSLGQLAATCEQRLAAEKEKPTAGLRRRIIDATRRFIGGESPGTQGNT